MNILLIWVRVVLEGSPRWPDSYDLSKCHYPHGLGTRNSHERNGTNIGPLHPKTMWTWINWLINSFLQICQKVLHSQKQLVQWAVYVTVEFYACMLSGWLRCNICTAYVQPNGGGTYAVLNQHTGIFSRVMGVWSLYSSHCHEEIH